MKKVMFMLLVIFIVLMLGCNKSNNETLEEPLADLDFSECLNKEVQDPQTIAQNESTEYQFLCRILYEYLVSQTQNLTFPDTDDSAQCDRVLYVAYTLFGANPPDFNVNDYVETDIFVCPKELFEKCLFEFFGSMEMNYELLSEEYLFDAERQMYTVYPGGYGSLQKFYIHKIEKISNDQLSITVDYYYYYEDNEPSFKLKFLIKTDGHKFQFLKVEKEGT